jgi:hypothetical protein
MTAVIPAGMATDDLAALWERLSSTDWNSSTAAYMTACDARRIIALTGMTQKAFAAECKARRIAGFGSQASVSRRIRWAELHEALWEAGILPEGVLIPEAVMRPLFDGKLSKADQIRHIAELFGPYLSEADKRAFADKLSEAMMREHLASQGHGPAYRAPRKYDPHKLIPRWLADGWAAGDLIAIIHQAEDSARNARVGNEM